MAYEAKDMNKKQSYTEYKVEAATELFTIGFEFAESEQSLHVRLNGIVIADLGYSFVIQNTNEIKITPAVQRGTLRISRETDIDENLYKFTAGAIFEARQMDADFEQIRDAQQELRDEVNFINSRWTQKDTVLEVLASTSFPEPEMVFGAYTTARNFSTENFYPHIASCVCDIDVTVGIYKNNIRVGTITVDHTDSKLSTVVFDTGIQTFDRGDVLTLKIETYHYTLLQLTVTLVGVFPLYDVV